MFMINLFFCYKTTVAAFYQLGALCFFIWPHVGHLWVIWTPQLGSHHGRHRLQHPSKHRWQHSSILNTRDMTMLLMPFGGKRQKRHVVLKMVLCSMVQSRVLLFHTNTQGRMARVWKNLVQLCFLSQYGVKTSKQKTIRCTDSYPAASLMYWLFWNWLNMLYLTSSDV